MGKPAPERQNHSGF